MSLRAKLLLLSLLTLVLPWAGCQYAQHMETALRRGQEESLLTTADVLAKVVSAEPELLYRVPELRERFNAQRGDVFAPLLTSPPLLDGFADEWPEPGRAVPGLHASLRLGIHQRSLQLYFNVRDANIRYERPRADDESPGTKFDRVIVLTRDDYGRESAWSLSAHGPGPLIARPCAVGAPWEPLPERINNIDGIWRATRGGYAIELRAPLSAVGPQLAVFAVDANGRTPSPMPLANLHTASQALQNRIERFVPSGARVSVVDAQGWLLARAGSVLGIPGSANYGMRPTEDGFLRSIYRPLFDRQPRSSESYGLPFGMWGAPLDEARAGESTAIWFEAGAGEPSLVRAAVPLYNDSEVIGALLIEQPGERLIELRDRALNQLLNFTLLATLLVVGITLLFAARLSTRIRRLSKAAGNALGPEGRIDARMPGVASRDEIGALARNFTTLLTRAQEYTSYLQTLGSKLSHELRTPLTIVSSSLENLSADATLNDESKTYLSRAREGATRLHTLLTALSEATRVEQSIDQAERVNFDLTDLVRSIGQAYQQSFPDRRIELITPPGPARLTGAPDLIAQLLDKLMDNAVSFSPTGGRIELALHDNADAYALSISNEGPSLPPELKGRLFESLVSHRSVAGDRPHLGLGLYIVRLIARFHHGSCRAENLTDGSGVRMEVELPKQTVE